MTLLQFIIDYIRSYIGIILIISTNVVIMLFILKYINDQYNNLHESYIQSSLILKHLETIISTIEQNLLTQFDVIHKAYDTNKDSLYNFNLQLDYVSKQLDTISMQANSNLTDISYKLSMQLESLSNKLLTIERILSKDN